MKTSAMAALFVAVMTAGCQSAGKELPRAQEPTAESQSYFCGMSVVEHAGPKGQIFLRGRTVPLWFGSARDAIAFSRLNDDASIAAIYVNDMGRASWEQPEAGTWIDARKSWFVIGSRRLGGMGIAEAIPFADHGAAADFTTRWGGAVVAYADIPGDYVLGGDADASRPSVAASAGAMP